MQKLNDWVRQRSEAAVDVVGLLPAILHASLDWGSPPPRRSPGNRAATSGEGAIGALCFAALILITILDFRSSRRVNFTLFYLVLITLAAWSGTRKTGIFIALMSSAAAFVNEVGSPVVHSLPWDVWWNLSMQMAVYLFAALLVSAIRNLTDTLERRVKERTMALEREIGERKQMEEQLRKTMQQFRQMAENITDAFWMREAGDMRMVYVSPAYELIWGRPCRALYQAPTAWLDAIHAEDREQVGRIMNNLQRVGEYNQEYRIVRPDGSMRRIRERAFPIRDGSGKVVRIVGIAEDITERHRLEREILEISDREQARIGQDLHDGLCQKLVSAAFDSNSLEQKLGIRLLPEVRDAQQIAEVLDDAITEARALARGLFPVQLEADGLTVALEQLAASVTARARVNCRLECPGPVSVRHNVVATHLYRIAQEAVNNAIKHARAESIIIELSAEDDRLQLTITDDGAGIPASRGTGGGMGLHIMNYRARTIGGSFRLDRGPNGGTVVSCSAPQQTAGI